MDIRAKVAQLAMRLHASPQYPTQGAVLFVDLERREYFSGYLSREVFRTFLTNRGANMYLLYNLLQEDKEPLDPEIPLIFGGGALTGNVPAATRGNVTGISPDSHAILDSNCGDDFPTFLKLHGYDHVVIYGQAPEWTLLKITAGRFSFTMPHRTGAWTILPLRRPSKRTFPAPSARTWPWPASPAPEKTWSSAAGIMGGSQIDLGPRRRRRENGRSATQGDPGSGRAPCLSPVSTPSKRHNRDIGEKILSASVIQNALKKVGTPFLYKPSRVLGAMGTKNNQQTTWHDSSRRRQLRPIPPGDGRLFQVPVRCRATTT